MAVVAAGVGVTEPAAETTGCWIKTPDTWPTWLLSEALIWPFSKAFRLTYWLVDVEVEPVELAVVATGVPVVAAVVAADVAAVVAAVVAAIVAWLVAAVVAAVVAALVEAIVAWLVAAVVAAVVGAVVAWLVVTTVPSGALVGDVDEAPPLQAARTIPAITIIGATNFLILVNSSFWPVLWPNVFYSTSSEKTEVLIPPCVTFLRFP